MNTEQRRYDSFQFFMFQHGIDARVTCSLFPVQIEGTVDGDYFYFRARGGEWTLSLGATKDEAISNAACGLHLTTGDDPYEGLMPLSLALALVWKVLKNWRKQKEVMK